MAIYVLCKCGQPLTARDEFAGRRAQCPMCGYRLILPEAPEPVAAKAVAKAAPGAVPSQAERITEFLDPPARPIAQPDRGAVVRRMFEALLDPRSIQWMLVFGGGLAVLGLIVWLASLGLFENKVILAVLMGIGTLGLLGAGWWIVLKTRFRVAGQALAFLACVVAPLNLWFYCAQGLVTLGEPLWIGGLVCALLYAATVYVLRDPLFLYAVEAGITLAAGLFLAGLGFLQDATAVSLALMMLGLASIHAERAFPREAEIFDRRRFGLPVFWSGHVQLAASLAVLLVAQIITWPGVERPSLLLDWAGGLVVESPWLAAGLWLAGTYAYLYSDLVVRRAGIYVDLAAVCFILAEMTVVGLNLQGEWFIAVLALTALGANLFQAYALRAGNRLNRAVPPLAMALSGLPILLGIALHLRATSDLVPEAWRTDTGWLFVGVMLLVAACNRISALLCRKTAPNLSAAYFFGSAAAAIVAAAGVLRMLGLTEWTRQAPWLMLLPIGYILGSRLWRGHSPERSLSRVAHVSTIVILLAGLGAAWESSTLEPVIHPRHGEVENLLLGIVFAEAAVFYTLAAVFRRRGAAVYFAAAAACGSLWQFLGYGDVPMAFQIPLYAILGVGLLAAARGLGIERAVVYRPSGWKAMVTQGRGLPAFQMGNAITSIALLAAILFGLSRLASHETDWALLGALGLSILAGLAAAALVPSGAWRRIHVTAAIAVTAVAFLALNVLIALNGWQKLEIFSVALGVLLMVLGYVGRFREDGGVRDDLVTLGLWFGSMLATAPLLIAVIYYRTLGDDISLIDELALLVVTVLMVVIGYSWQVKSTTLVGGSALVLYLVMIVVSIGWRQQLTIAAVLAVLGALVFGCGIVLSVYRQKLLDLPEQIANREGVFRLLDWR